MIFCEDCGMLYFIHISDTNSNQLIHFCRKCGKKQDIITEDNICVSKINLTHKSHKTRHMVNEYTKFDPTLPRINNIPCVNSACDSNKKKNPHPSEVIYMRYDDINMKYIYICTICDNIWKLDEIKN